MLQFIQERQNLLDNDDSRLTVCCGGGLCVVITVIVSTILHAVSMTTFYSFWFLDTPANCCEHDSSDITNAVNMLWTGLILSGGAGFFTIVCFSVKKLCAECVSMKLQMGLLMTKSLFDVSFRVLSCVIVIYSLNHVGDTSTKATVELFFGAVIGFGTNIFQHTLSTSDINQHPKLALTAFVVRIATGFIILAQIAVCIAGFSYISNPPYSTLCWQSVNLASGKSVDTRFVECGSNNCVSNGYAAVGTETTTGNMYGEVYSYCVSNTEYCCYWQRKGIGAGG